MLGSDAFVSNFGSTAGGDDEMLIRIAANAVRSGLAIVFNKPGEKRPVCILSSVERNRADKAAREEAAVIGDPMFAKRKHKCGIDHAITLKSLTASEEFPEGDPKKVATKVGVIIRRLAKLNGGVYPNIGVELGKSRMLVVDVDTLAEKEGFITDWHRQDTAQAISTSGAEHDMPGMTVQSPGKQNVAGEWVHKHGGHYWFALPDDVVFPASQGALKAESGWVAMWDRHQVLVPPSSRAEGNYELIGNLLTPPDWLIAKIMHEAQARMDRARNRELPDGSGDLDQWSAITPWSDLLLPDDWTETGLPDRCSCPIWTAPGDHASPKSLTAHDIGCDVYDASGGHAPAHVWTDNPPEWLQTAIRQTNSKTFTKINWTAWRDFEGNTTSALRGLGFNKGAGSVALDDWHPSQIVDESPAGAISEDEFGELGTGEDEDDTGSEVEIGVAEPEQDDDSWKSIPLHGRSDDDEEEPPSLMPRSDGVISLLYRGLIHSIHGESESGKSWIVQAEVVRVVKDNGRVLFLDFENDYRAVLRRFRALGATEDDLTRIDYRNPDAKPDFAGKWWRGMFTGEFDIIVLDGVTDALGLFAMGSKDNDEISTFLRKFPRALARRTGAAVVLIDHVVKSTAERGRWALGGQAKMAGLDGAAYSVDVVEPLGRGLKGMLRIRVAKDKPGFVRGVAQGFDKDRLGDVARFVMDATENPIRTELLAPDPFEEKVPELPEWETDDELTALRVLSMEKNGFPSQTKFVEMLIGRPAKWHKVIKHLVELGQIALGEPGARGAAQHTLTGAGRGRLEEEDSR